jgi:hypothetical protein
MFENTLQTRAAICGSGLLLSLIFLLAHLPIILQILPVAILFLGIVADPEETHAVWYGMLYTLGIFDLAELNAEEKENLTAKRHYFWFGEVALASVMAGIFAVPTGIFLAGRTDLALSVIGAAAIFLPIFVFLPKILRQVAHIDPESALELFGKNEQVRKVFWTLFLTMTGLVLAEILDPASAQKIIGVLAGVV